MNIKKIFQEEKGEYIKKIRKNKKLKKFGFDFLVESIRSKYSYNFKWLGRPIIQYPQDIIAMQEIIWSVKPDLIVETGIAHGGSLIFYASMLELIGDGLVLGIDIDIREHNRKEIEAHPMLKRIKMIEGSSIDENVVKAVYKLTKNKKRILVCLDSNHTYDQVVKELEFYSPLVTKGSYIVVFDTIIEDLPANALRGRSWGRGDSPKTAVEEFLKKHKNFSSNKEIEEKIIISVAPGGYLKRNY